MFNKDFFPTPSGTIETMLQGYDVCNKTILEPSAGKGDIVDFLTINGAKSVLACEIDPTLRKILEGKCNVIESDFLNLTSDKISHVDFIVMNPPFSADERHILHAYDIAPDGCTIIALCNYQTYNNAYTSERKRLKQLIESYGTIANLKDAFSTSERKTDVFIGLIRVTKPSINAQNEYEGFFMDEEPEERQENGIMSYNVVRDLVNRYVSALKIYDEQLESATKLNSVLSGFYGTGLGFQCMSGDKPVKRNEFKKDLQKSGWKFIFNKMNLNKHITKGVNEDINKFVEQQTEIPFTMRNIYHMLDMVVQTAGQRMDKAILEVFDRVTNHHHENRHNIKGWKTNSHYLVGKKFILPYQISPATEYGYTTGVYTSLKNSWDGTMADFEKALCFVNGINYDEIDRSAKKDEYIPNEDRTINRSINRNTYGVWYESKFFKYKGYKNGNMHFEFMDENVWALFNQRVAKLKGYPLPEKKEQTAYQKRQTNTKDAEPMAKRDNTKQFSVLFEFDV